MSANTHDLYAGIGRRIGAYRRMSKMTAEDLAQRVPGLTRSGLAKIESGIRAVLPVELLVDIAYALDVPLNVLVFPVGLPNSTVPAGGEAHRMGDLLSWVVGPGDYAEGEYETSAGAHASLIVETARGLVTAEREAIKITDEAGAGAFPESEESRRALEEARSRAFHSSRALSFVWMQLPGMRVAGPPAGAEDVD